MEGLPLLSVSIHRGVIPRSEVTDAEPRADDLSNYKLVDAGEIVINRMSAYQGALGIARERGIASPEYIVLRPNDDVDPRYLTYLFKSSWFVSQMTSRLRGIGGTEQGNVRTPRINPEDLGGITVTVPSWSRQAVIANYLDLETARIAALIEKKQQMTELIDERATAYLCSIFDAAPGARRSLRAIASVALGRQRSPENDEGPYMVRYLRAANVKDGWLDLEDVKSMNFTPAEQERFALRQGDVLVTEGAGSLAAVGASCVWGDELEGTVCIQNTLLRLRPQSGIDGEFLAWWCRYAYRSHLFASIASGANIFHLSAEKVRTVACVVPALEEQKRIVNRLSESFAKGEYVRSKLVEQIDLLIEHRQALITAAVTGELKFQGVAV